MAFRDAVAAGAQLVREALQSAGFVSGSTGWQIRREGGAEFHDVIVRGDIESSNYSPGSTGWHLDDDGTAEFHGDVSITDGTLSATDTGLGNRISVGGSSADVEWDTTTFTTTDRARIEGYVASAAPSDIVSVALVLDLDPAPGREAFVELIRDSDGSIRCAVSSDRFEINGNDIVPTLFGAWTNYTPALGNISLGTGSTVDARYKMLDAKTCVVQTYVVLGTGGSLLGNATIGLPFTPRNDLMGMAACMYLDAGTRWRVGAGRIRQAAKHVELVHDETTNAGNVGATSPFTWGPNDRINMTTTYEIA